MQLHTAAFKGMLFSLVLSAFLWGGIVWLGAFIFR